MQLRSLCSSPLAQPAASNPALPALGSACVWPWIRTTWNSFLLPSWHIQFDYPCWSYGYWFPKLWVGTFKSCVHWTCESWNWELGGSLWFAVSWNRMEVSRAVLRCESAPIRATFLVYIVVFWPMMTNDIQWWPMSYTSGPILYLLVISQNQRSSLIWKLNQHNQRCFSKYHHLRYSRVGL